MQQLFNQIFFFLKKRSSKLTLLCLSMLSFFVFSCDQDEQFIEEIIEEEIITEWSELSGNWNLDILSPSPKTSSTGGPFVLARKDMKIDSRWTEMSVDFKIDGDVTRTSIGFALNAIDSEDFGIVRFKFNYFEAGLWKYNYYRPWMKIKMEPIKQNNWYNLKIEFKQKSNDWRPWTLTLIDKESGTIILEQGIDNTLPLFGRGITGLYADIGAYTSEGQVLFKNFSIKNPPVPAGEEYLQLAPLFSDGMIMQRNVTVPIWGLAKPREDVVIEFYNQTFSATANNQGRWSINLPSMGATTSLNMLVTSLTDSVNVRDIAVGEVWLASGQSNMALAVSETDMSTQVTPDTDIRIFLQPQWPAIDPVFDGGGNWENAQTGDVSKWSALAYSFAKQLREELNVPIGIIGSYWGGTSAESWMPREILGSDPITKTILDQYNSALNSLESGQPIVGVDAFNVPDQSHAPGYLYNGMIHPHIPFAMSGVIWYQGESNTLRAEQYETLFPMLIQSWRDAWNKPDMNFLFAQLAGYDGQLTGNNIKNAWSHIREGQRLALNKLENTGMAVAIDLGDKTNVHPIHKRELGERFIRLALHDVYRYDNIVRSGPLFESVHFIGNSAILTFTEIDLGLQIRSSNILSGFVIAGTNKQFLPALAEINPDGKSIRVWSDNISSPVAVRYAWENYPINANLINNADLPASPFRTDNWSLY